MATERIQIIVSERGSREVRRNLDDIGRSATSAEGALTLLKRTLGTLSVGFLLHELVQLADTYANIQNRLRLVTKSTGELSSVTKELFAISVRTRSSFEGTAQLFARVALNSKALGRSQQELLQFTESLNQAVILSGASAREAEGAIIQLAQGMASGRLQGDELRSVLEQLPLVADIIAQHMGVTRGELRELAADGKVAAGTILDAFANARVELADKFARTIPTIGQSIEVLRTKFIQLWGEFTQTSGLAALLSQSIYLLANNLGLLTQAVTVLATIWIARWIGGALIAGGAAITAYIAEMAALNVALGATTTRAAMAGVAMKSMQLGMAAVFSVGNILTVALAALAATLVYMYTSGQAAKAILEGLEQSGRTAANELFDLEAKARAAGMNVDSLNNAAATGNPLLIAIAASYGKAADEAGRLAENARQAAIQVAMGRIAELQAQREQVALAPKGIISNFRRGTQVIDAWLGWGPSLQERAQGAANIDQQIDIYRRQIDLLREVPDSVFAPRPYVEPPGKPKKTKGGGGRTDADILADFDRQLRIDTELAALNGAEHDKLAAIRQVETQLNRELTASELEYYGALLDNLQAVKDLAMFKEWSDYVRQEVTLLGLSNRERERQEEIFRIENQLKRQLTETEKGLVNARLDELQVARDQKQLREFTEDLQDENRLLMFNGREREVRTELLRLERDIGRELTASEREFLELLLRQNLALNEQNQMLENTVGKRQEWIEKAMDAYALLRDADSGFTQGDAFDELTGDGLNQFFDGTDAMLESQLEKYRNYYEQVRVLEEMGVVSHRSAQEAMKNIDVAMQEARLTQTRSFLDTLAGLQRSNVKELAAIGKAAAITQATIDGFLAIQKALAAYPPPFNFIAAAAVGAVTAANIANIVAQPVGGYMTGGEFTVGGGGGPDSKMVAFRATPGEKVSVQTPSQQRKGSVAFQDGEQTAPVLNARIINIIDPAMVADFLASPEGEVVFENRLRYHSDVVQRIASGNVS